MQCSHCYQEIERGPRYNEVGSPIEAELDELPCYPYADTNTRRYNTRRRRLDVHCFTCAIELYGKRSLTDWRDEFNVFHCKVCDERFIAGGPTPAVYCSTDCRRTEASQRRKAKRTEVRNMEVSEHFDCHRCKQQIDGVVVFWYVDRQVVAWCEDCLIECRTEEDREDFKSGYSKIDPDAPGYDPFYRQWQNDFELHQCHCGRVIRNGHNGDLRSMGYCCERCQYEAQKEARHVERATKICQSCNEEFTPTRSDAKTCSDGCRQELHRRMKRKARRAARRPSRSAMAE